MFLDSQEPIINFKILYLLYSQLYLFRGRYPLNSSINIYINISINININININGLMNVMGLICVGPGGLICVGVK